MKKLKLSKLPSSEINAKAIKLTNENGIEIGLVVVDGFFVPGEGIEFSASDLKQVVVIQENFWIFWENIKG